jgi:cobalamin transport system substrate-binding protein
MMRVLASRTGVFVLIAAAVVASHALPVARAAAGNVTNGCARVFDGTADYFPDKVRIEDAVNFSVQYHPSYKVVTVREADSARLPER